ncbi:MAG: hypothetical protein ACM3X7_01155 [Solirubrobacterales bacterium]
MADIEELIILEKEKLHNMIIKNNCDVQDLEILAQSKKLDLLITMYLYDSVQYVAATKIENE